MCFICLNACCFIIQSGCYISAKFVNRKSGVTDFQFHLHLDLDLTMLLLTPLLGLLTLEFVKKMVISLGFQFVSHTFPFDLPFYTICLGS
jgi:hypothetical protein